MGAIGECAIKIYTLLTYCMVQKLYRYVELDLMFGTIMSLSSKNNVIPCTFTCELLWLS